MIDPPPTTVEGHPEAATMNANDLSRAPNEKKHRPERPQARIVPPVTSPSIKLLSGTTQKLHPKRARF